MILSGIFCEPIQNPLNGYYITSDDSFVYGSTVSFGCNVGFSLHGGDTLRCTKEGKWSNRRQAECKGL